MNNASNPSRLACLLILGLIVPALLIAWLTLFGNTFGGAGYLHMMENLPAPSAWLRWVMGDISEMVFYKHELASLGLLAGAGLAHWAHRRGKAWQGFAICYGSGLWPWLIGSSLLGLLLSNLLWGWTVPRYGWQPTFAAFVSVPAATVLLFGAGMRIAVNGAVMGALLVTPLCLLLVNFVCNPLNLPAVIGNVLGMAMGSVIAFTLCRHWPVLVKPEAPVAAAPAPAQPTGRHGLIWGLRRVLADFSEAPFFGNEWASLGLLLGVLLAYGLNSAGPVYGSDLLLPILAAQALASAIGVMVWRRQWMARGWYPTYIPIVSVAPAAVLVHGGGALVVIVSALLGALIAPPLAVALSRRVPGHMHPYIGNVLSMALSTLLIVPLIGWLTRIL
ncbi:hypothetical protein [Pseudomonas batumici]|uniref:Uncharacterized protein n=1 Tax=Pseudomonas batumici TaxID=226910 RepID=A0A0C2HXI9_9PSED|nr:hypothetical protein [Pseudomonas batumici]KIH81876.1 hypothetical protein UCMB321_4539 [Pseudomonas batumici]